MHVEIPASSLMALSLKLLTSLRSNLSPPPLLSPLLLLVALPLIPPRAHAFLQASTRAHIICERDTPSSLLLLGNSPRSRLRCLYERRLWEMFDRPRRRRARGARPRLEPLASKESCEDDDKTCRRPKRLLISQPRFCKGKSAQILRLPPAVQPQVGGVKVGGA